MNKLTPEQIESNLAAYKHAMEVGHMADIDLKSHYDTWIHMMEQDMRFFADNLYRIRPKPPEPKWRAWTYETCPLGVHIINKNERSKWVIHSVVHDGVRIGHSQFYTYAELLRSFEQPDGKPAGVREEV